MTSKSSGNALIYVLIAVILLGALSFAISRSSDSNPNAEISDAAAKAAATSILAYEAEAKMAVNQMIQNGTKVTDINFDFPSASTFNSGETTKKLFHPDGGGLQYKSLPSTAVGQFYQVNNAYYIGRFNNVEWTPTIQQDVLFTAYGIKDVLCKELNKKIIGNTNNIDIGASYFRIVVPSSFTGSALDMNTTTAPNANSLTMACLRYSAGGDRNAFYSILVAR